MAATEPLVAPEYGTVRVIAGRFKGQRLAAPRQQATRPTQDRVREAIFNLLGPIDEVDVLDLYAGSGALGIEALSRGAGSATFVDSSPDAIRAMRRNLSRLRVQNAQVVRSPVPGFLRWAARRGELWTLVFCDPPYRLADRLARDLDELLPLVLAAEARVVCESSFRQPLGLHLPLHTERRYGDTLVAVYSHPGEEDADDER